MGTSGGDAVIFTMRERAFYGVPLKLGCTVTRSLVYVEMNHQSNLEAAIVESQAEGLLDEHYYLRSRCGAPVDEIESVSPRRSNDWIGRKCCIDAVMPI